MKKIKILLIIFFLNLQGNLLPFKLIITNNFDIPIYITQSPIKNLHRDVNNKFDITVQLEGKQGNRLHMHTFGLMDTPKCEQILQYQNLEIEIEENNAPCLISLCYYVESEKQICTVDNVIVISKHNIKDFNLSPFVYKFKFAEWIDDDYKKIIFEIIDYTNPYLIINEKHINKICGDVIYHPKDSNTGPIQMDVKTW